MMTIATHTSDAAKARVQREPDPDECPDIYASTARGNCLEPVYRDGVCLVFSKSETPVAGDYVGIWLDPACVEPGTPARPVKRLVMGVPDIEFPFRLHPKSGFEPMIVFEQLNPPRTYCVGASHIRAIHKLIGIATSNGDGTAHYRPADTRPQGENQ